ncbi:UDP-N-acetylglucosamine pyrophosphorylase [Linnemannia schmuckeri]|uniref:UDP-N-acetylglucosamine diphosphorylase n=1 Tax=Linnemannia schmuckeri TaxID=64567 RepID=A0A9P5RNR1_9FUNG|nr:UDP-N-acetylglucosamine pyrophosphorylase [Linnemannia schmuckeri]
MTQVDPARLSIVRQKYKDAHQDHVFTFWEDLSPQQQHTFFSQLESIDPKALNSIFQKAIHSSQSSAIFNDLQPLAHSEVKSTTHSSLTEQLDWEQRGLDAIANNHVAVIVLAGGQGTRLGSSLPKGSFPDVGLPSHKTLFQIHAERIKRLQTLARIHQASKTGRPMDDIPMPTITWCIMTSGATHERTETFLKQHAYFGLLPENIIVFQQGVIPSFDLEGKILLSAKDRIAASPNGNGGIFWALHTEGVLEALQKRGILYTHIYSVDNILIKIGDPVGIGHALATNADVTSKVMPKTRANEPLGVICHINGLVKVVEYSEMDIKLAALIDPNTGEFVYRAGNVCNQIFSVDFLARIPPILLTPDQDLLIYHPATKRIPFIDLTTGQEVEPNTPNGIKLELFIFDAFTLAERFACLEVERASEFSPMKNLDGLDSPATCRRDLERLHIRWIEQAGGHVAETPSSLSASASEDLLGFEISPMLSYGGEGLEWVRGKTIQACHLETKDDAHSL